MKKKLLSAFFLFLFLSLIHTSLHTKILSFSGLYALKIDNLSPQSVKKPEFDYMSSILSRNTNPLGLKDNLPLRRFLNQSSIKWAFRAGGKHILN
jgi:hypothetical protein